MNPTISVIVAVYNVEKYLPTCLESIAAQTFNDIEVILVDDGSTDRSGEICDTFCEKDNRFKVIHQSNLGTPSTRNNGMNVSKGEYIYFMDSDDYIHPKIIEVLYNAIRSTGCEVSMVKGRRTKFGDTNKKEISIPAPQIKSQEWFFYGMFVSGSTNWNYMVVWNKLYNRKLIADIAFQCAISQDTIFNTQVIIRTERIAFVDCELYNYVNRSDSITNFGHKTTRYIREIEPTYICLQYLPETHSRYRAYCLEYAYKRILSIRLEAHGTEHEAYAKKVIEKARQDLSSEFKRNKYISLSKKVSYYMLLKFPVLYRTARKVLEIKARLFR